MLKHLCKEPPHPTTEVYNKRFQNHANIDNDLVPLITVLWELDIQTALSCSHNSTGMAWIRFYNVDCALRFLEVAVSQCNRIDYRVNVTDPIPQPDIYFHHHYLPTLVGIFTILKAK